MLARPLETLSFRGSLREIATSVVRVIERLQDEPDGLACVVIGLPRHLDGRASELTNLVLEFAEHLRPRLSLPVVLHDERLSSREAESRLALTERDWRKRKLKLDAASAAVVLQDYLDTCARRST